MTSRREERRVAIDVLYQADITDAAPAAVLEEWGAAGREVPPFSRALVAGVDDHRPAIDLLLETHATGWTVARMTALDRTILRVAVEEVRYRDDVPDAVAISEAVEAADELSTEESKRFVNGILGQIAREGRTAP
ncbi:MAG TPA: transcription antitermination factor NusB [Actinomycetota bacterium]|nr:transcription antitermination factor NusB [Actinomycetota bacterium]